MPLSELKYEFIRTPLERPLLALRRALGWRERRRHPELADIHMEEARIERVLARVLRPDSWCVDIGCHYGSMLSRFCRLAPAGRHVAFEVIPAKVRFLRRKFPEVDVRQVALLDHPGHSRFFVYSRASGFSSLARSTPQQAEGIEVEEIEVETARLDDALAPAHRVDFLKVDVEGAELFVLRGAKAALARHRPVVLFECGPGGPRSFGYEPGELYDFLTRDAGFSVFSLKVYLANASPVGRA